MQLLRRFLTLAPPVVCLVLSTAIAQTPTVGSGAPNPTLASAIVQSYFSNQFYTLVSNPIANVAKLGATGYVQEFYDVNQTAGVKYALIATPSGNLYNVFQAYPAVYAYYAQIGVTTAGYPTTNTQQCPAFVGTPCTYQFFDKPYALFVYSSAVNGATTYFTNDPFYTKWNTLGGISSMGPPTSAATAFTSPSGNIATIQTYNSGFIANITGGNATPRIAGVKQPIYSLYASNGGYTGPMGLPLSEELVQPNGHRRQSFERGTVDYDPNTPGSATLLLPVKSIQIAPALTSSTALNISEGQTVTLTATALASDSSILTGRLFTWNTTNGRIVSLTANGDTAVIKGVSGGSANITVSSEGVTSPVYGVFVSAPCCAVGEGAPTSALQQSFNDAITRNRLNPKIPAANPVVRTGAGYLQQLQTADTGEVFWLAAAQSTGNAYLVRGTILAEYQNQGGPIGKLGYPLSDATAGGRQTFEGGALAGSPVQLVTSVILAKWALLGYEAGSAGSPTGAAAPFLTFRATAGNAQTFTAATILSVASGAQSGKVFTVSGPILAAYAGPTSAFGAPVADEIALNGVRHQDFEGGYMEYTPGDSLARQYPAPRTPTVSATPASPPAGSVVRLSLGGFDAGAQVRVSISGQQDFLATVPTGAYIWENYIPATAASSTITIKAVDTNSQASSQATYSIRSTSDARLTLKTIAGDTQTGLPGATLPVRIQVSFTDDAGNPIPNAAVRFTASPGGQVGPDASTVTDTNGVASAGWRLPSDEGTAILAVSAGGRTVNVTARAARSGLTNFPALSQTSLNTPLGNGADPISAKGALLTSVAAAIRYYQNRSQMPTTNGLADPILLNTYLKSQCVSDSTGAQTCDGFLQPAGSTDQIVNLWRLRNFVGNQLDIRTITPNDGLIRDAITQGAPVILALSLTQNGAPAGSHFVVATGVDSTGNLSLLDPKYGQGSFYSYLYGFQSGGATIAGTVTGAATVTAQIPATPGFLIAVSAPTSLQSANGRCGAPFIFPISGASAFALHYCDAAAATFYELDMQPADSSSNFQGTFIDLGPSATRADISGGGATSFAIDHSTGQWTIAPLSVQFLSSGVINAASLTGDLAPGQPASINGAGLASPGALPIVAVNGEYAPILNATPFRLDFQIPADTTPGAVVLDVVSDLAGTAEQTITVRPYAPAIQLVNGVARSGRVLNADGSVNTRYKPVMRGQTLSVNATGFGDLVAPIQATIGGVAVAVSSVKAVAATPGLYQVTLAIPANFTPGLALELVLQQGGFVSNAVDVSIQ